MYLNWASVRNGLLAAYGLRSPSDKIIAVPYNGNPDRMRHFILHEFLGTGSFGWVRACVDRRTGNPYALKQLAIKSMLDRKHCAREVDLMLEFKVDTPNSFDVLTYGDLSRQNWSACNDHLFIASMLRGPLQGLQTLHSRGFIHRDITMKNILIRSMSPPDAIIADFGKTIKATRASETRIGPIYSLPPEVNGKDYDNKIDIYSFGIACFRTIIPTADFKRLEQPSDFHKYFSALQKYAKRSTTHSVFADLLQSMLSPEPTERPSASQALLHPFFDLCNTPPEPELRHQNTSDKGNIQYDDKPGKIAKLNSTESTIPFT
ncbi:serine/threonine protein kinase, CMGC, CDC2/CDK subfamily [Clarireedia jacksonii]